MKARFKNAQSQTIFEMDILNAARNIRRFENQTLYTFVIRLERNLNDVYNALQNAKTIQILDGNKVVFELDITDKTIHVEETSLGSNSVMIYISLP